MTQSGSEAISLFPVKTMRLLRRQAPRNDMLRNIGYLLIIVIFAAIPLPVCGDEPVLIQRMEIMGVSAFKIPAARNAMLTKFPSPIPWKKRPDFNESLLRNDMKRIGNLYKSKGYFSVQADYSASIKEGRAYITITVNEGSPFTTENIAIEFAAEENAALRENLFKEIVITTGTHFSVEPYERSKARLEAYCANHGYSRARVSGRVIADLLRHTADVRYLLDQGPLQYIGNINIAGNNVVSERFIRPELAFSEGSLFSRARLGESRRALYSLGLFRSVRFVQSEENDGAIIPVDVVVEEADKRQVRMGAGYGTEDNLRLFTEWNRLYFLDGLRTLKIAVQYSGIMADASVSFLQRYFISRRNTLSATLGVNRQKVADYTNERIAAQARTQSQLRPDLSAFASYILEINRPAGVPPAVIEALKESDGGKFYVISGFAAQTTFATARENENVPSGMTHSLYMETSSYLFGAGLDYIKGILESRAWEPAFWGTTLAARVKFGLIEPSHLTREIPVFKRFFAGGSYSVRGYGYQEIGPRDEQGNLLGGRYLLEAGLELRLPLFHNAGLALFVDMGDVYLSRFDFGFARARYGTGVGIRYATPLGPLGADVAVPFEYGVPLELKNYKIYVTIGHVY